MDHGTESHVLGIDAGGTKTVCLLANEHAEILAESRGGGANLQTAGELEVEKVLRRLTEKDIELKLEQSALDFLVEEGSDPAFGARPMRRAVERYIEDPVAEQLLRGDIKEGDSVAVTYKAPKEGEEKALTFKPKGSRKAQTAKSSS